MSLFVAYLWCGSPDFIPVVLMVGSSQRVLIKKIRSIADAPRSNISFRDAKITDEDDEFLHNPSGPSGYYSRSAVDSTLSENYFTALHKHSGDLQEAPAGHPKGLTIFDVRESESEDINEARTSIHTFFTDRTH